jgi:hypothetical protein
VNKNGSSLTNPRIGFGNNKFLLKGESTMETNTLDITIRVPSNADNASIAAALRMRAGLFEGMTGKEAASRKNTDGEQLANGVDHAEVAATAAAKTGKGKGKAAAKPAAEPEENFDLGDMGMGEETMEVEAPKVTLKDVITACQVYCSKGDDATKAKNRAHIAKLLEKFGAGKSVQNLKPENFDKMLAAIGGK